MRRHDQPPKHHCRPSPHRPLAQRRRRLLQLRVDLRSIRLAERAALVLNPPAPRAVGGSRAGQLSAAPTLPGSHSGGRSSCKIRHGLPTRPPPPLYLHSRSYAASCRLPMVSISSRPAVQGGTGTQAAQASGTLSWPPACPMAAAPQPARRQQAASRPAPAPAHPRAGGACAAAPCSWRGWRARGPGRRRIQGPPPHSVQRRSEALRCWNESQQQEAALAQLQHMGGAAAPGRAPSSGTHSQRRCCPAMPSMPAARCPLRSVSAPAARPPRRA